MYSDKYQAKIQLIDSCLRYVKSYFYMEVSLPGPYDDAEMEYCEDLMEETSIAFLKGRGYEVTKAKKQGV